MLELVAGNKTPVRTQKFSHHSVCVLVVVASQTKSDITRFILVGWLCNRIYVFGTRFLISLDELSRKQRSCGVRGSSLNVFVCARILSGDDFENCLVFRMFFFTNQANCLCIAF